ncbi:hypothetical protein U9M48_038575 [Paspalum notatum var. saurae]|uniref:Uncharacterized protein n=1 Tax=Paspalum notatum var. saurae TaxID=547442 RepID=A0AAQ3XB71_PASNO
MYNPEEQPARQQGPQQQQQLTSCMAPPRMSFSSDFALEPPPPRRPAAGGRADADFEFSPVGSRPMMAADQLFSKGRILPLREAPAPSAPATTTTLRDELRAQDADRARRAGGGARWKELLGLKRAAHGKKPGAGSAAGADAAHHVDLGVHGEE